MRKIVLAMAVLGLMVALNPTARAQQFVTFHSITSNHPSWSNEMFGTVVTPGQTFYNASGYNAHWYNRQGHSMYGFGAEYQSWNDGVSVPKTPQFETMGITGSFYEDLIGSTVSVGLDLGPMYMKVQNEPKQVAIELEPAVSVHTPYEWPLHIDARVGMFYTTSRYHANTGMYFAVGAGFKL